MFLTLQKKMSGPIVEYLLLEITISTQGTRNNRDTCRFTVNAKKVTAPEPEVQKP